MYGAEGGGGGGGGGSKWNSNLPRSLNTTGIEWSLDPPSPMNVSRSSSLRKTGDDSNLPSDYSPGLLDLHSLDTELISEVHFP